MSLCRACWEGLSWLVDCHGVTDPKSSGGTILVLECIKRKKLVGHGQPSFRMHDHPHHEGPHPEAGSHNKAFLPATACRVFSHSKEERRPASTSNKKSVIIPVSQAFSITSPLDSCTHKDGSWRTNGASFQGLLSSASFLSPTNGLPLWTIWRNKNNKYLWTKLFPSWKSINNNYKPIRANALGKK